MSAAKYPKRLIEVDLPIKKISEHARNEKKIRHGTISAIHIWWARRPLAACRAVICAALWPDPAQEDCPPRFREDAATIMDRFWNPLGRVDIDFNDSMKLRQALLDFIADYSNWDNSTKKEYLETARALTRSAHEALGGLPGTRPLVADPFAGGGSIPLESLRVGADAFASDLNPVAVLLNKVVLQYIPKYGQTLAGEVRKWGEWIKIEAEKELGQFYPEDPDGAKPIAYLWARTITCEGPGCGAKVPLMRSMWLSDKSKHSVALKMVPVLGKKCVNFEIIQNANEGEVGIGTIRRGSGTCPICGYTTPVASIRRQLKNRRGGADDARLLCVVTVKPYMEGRFYRLPIDKDFEAIEKAKEELERRNFLHRGSLSLVPDELLPIMSGVFNAPIYGHDTWGGLFTHRQALALTTISGLIKRTGKMMEAYNDLGLATAVQTCLALSLDKQADLCSALTTWKLNAECPVHLFCRQAIPMVWDFAETGLLSESSGSWQSMYERTAYAIQLSAFDQNWTGNVEKANATMHPLPDDSAQVFFTDPPYYNAVPYADLSDFFYVWLSRTIGNIHADLFKEHLSPKDEEICEMAGWDSIRYSYKDGNWFEKHMTQAMAEGRRVLAPDGIGIIVFAHKSTRGWEAMLQAMINAGWIFTGSWPIDTEMGARLRAMNSAVLASSIHLVCRPRESSDGTVMADDIGYWSDVLAELPNRIHAWMPRLAAEGVVGADAIFSCLGPALEIYSRYSRVEKASGEVVTLKDYLEEVWAAVSREALGMIFEDADASGFEEDARLTAMWLWTLNAGASANSGNGAEEESEDEEAVEASSWNGGKIRGFILEYDAARKIAQGLGCHLEKLTTLVEIKRDKARLLPVSERASYLFGHGVAHVAKKGRKKKEQQTTLSGGIVAQPEATGSSGELSLPSPGSTVLDRLHQAMLLFSNGQGDALKRFIEDLSKDQGLWKLAQSFSGLYPAGSEERRSVEGVLARKKSLGL